MVKSCRKYNPCLLKLSSINFLHLKSLGYLLSFILNSTPDLALTCSEKNMYFYSTTVKNDPINVMIYGTVPLSNLIFPVFISYLLTYRLCVCVCVCVCSKFILRHVSLKMTNKDHLLSAFLK